MKRLLLLTALFLLVGTGCGQEADSGSGAEGARILSESRTLPDGGAESVTVVARTAAPPVSQLPSFRKGTVEVQCNRSSKEFPGLR